MTTSIAEQLQEASDSLTEATWHKGSYFAQNGGSVCFCAHGAVQKVVNPTCKEAFVAYDTAATSGQSPKVPRTERAAAHAAEAARGRSDAAAAAAASEVGSAATAVAWAAATFAAEADATVAAEHAAGTRFIGTAATAACAAAEKVARWRRESSPASASCAAYIFAQRPSWVREVLVNYGCLDAHFIMGEVGLTDSFNDHKDTTLAMVKEKFSQAIALAKELGV